MSRFHELFSPLRLPVVAAPMFLVSGPQLVSACLRAGISAAFPAQNARTTEELSQWMEQIAAVSAETGMPWISNLIVHKTNPRFEADLEVILEHRPPILITALGSPRRVVEAAHGVGTLVLADVASPRHAEKALAAGVDGLVLIAAGAGGHTGSLSPFAFVDAVCRFWDGPLVLGGGIASGRGIHAARAMGADLAYMGTRFIAVEESLAQPAYRQMCVDASVRDIVLSAKITGINANWLEPSLAAAGIDMSSASMDWGKLDAEARRWANIWSAGQGVGETRAVLSVADLVDELAAQYAHAVSRA